MSGEDGRDGAAPGGGAPPPGSNGLPLPNAPASAPNAPAAVPSPSFMAPPPADPSQVAANGAMLQMMQMMSQAAGGGLQPQVAAAMQGAYGQAALAAAFSNPNAFGAAMRAMQAGMFSQPPAAPSAFVGFPNPLAQQHQQHSFVPSPPPPSGAASVGAVAGQTVATGRQEGGGSPAVVNRPVALVTRPTPVSPGSVGAVGGITRPTFTSASPPAMSPPLPPPPSTSSLYSPRQPPAAPVTKTSGHQLPHTGTQVAIAGAPSASAPAVPTVAVVETSAPAAAAAETRQAVEVRSAETRCVRFFSSPRSFSNRRSSPQVLRYVMHTAARTFSRATLESSRANPPPPKTKKDNK